MGEILQQIDAPNSASSQSGSQQSGPQSRQQQAAPVRPQPGVVVDVNNQAATDAPKKVLIDKGQLEQFLKRHPEVLQAMAQEMQQAATAGTVVPQSIPITQMGQQISQQVADSSQRATAPQPQQSAPAVQAAPAQQGAMRRLVTMPTSSPPSSPYGLGEMNLASRVDITSLDTHAELYQTDFSIQPVKKSLKGYQQASGAYAHQAGIDPIRYQEDEARKNNPDVQRRMESAQNIKAALQSALTGPDIPQDVSANQQTMPVQKPRKVSLAPSTVQNASQQVPKQQKASSLTQPAPSGDPLEQRKAEILPYAMQYARSMGYAPEKGETEKILQDTVNFYSKSDKLANTLKNLVKVLPQT